MNCIWKYYYKNSGSYSYHYDTTCDKAYHDIGNNLDFKFCPYCGKEIELSTEHLSHDKKMTSMFYLKSLSKE